MWHKICLSWLLGALTKLSCAPGTYQPDSGQSSCVNCTNGAMCPGFNTTSPSLCKLGYYCPSGLPIPCPNGTYGKHLGLKGVHQCSDCPSGKYCPGLANTSPNLTCASGWYCQGGASSATPSRSTKFPGNGPCRAGRISFLIFRLLE